MALIPDSGSSPATQRIISYTALELRLTDRVITHSALIFGASVTDWPVRQPSDLNDSTLAPLRALGVDLVLLATGERQQFPAIDFLNATRRAGLALEVMDTGAACRTYNVLISEDRAVALAVIFP